MVQPSEGCETGTDFKQEKKYKGSESNENIHKLGSKTIIANKQIVPGVLYAAKPGPQS